MTPEQVAERLGRPNAYLQLLDEYHRMIRTEPWWDGRREALVRRMDRVWARLNGQQRAEALSHAARLYEQGLTR